jgi:hypothetical protein
MLIHPFCIYDIDVLFLVQFNVEMLAMIQEQKPVTSNTESCNENEMVESMIESFLSPPEGEEEILQEIQELVGTLDESAEQQTEECVGSALDSHYSSTESLPTDGDFLEMSDLFPSFSDSSMNSSVYEPIRDTWGNITGCRTLDFSDANGFEQTNADDGAYDQAKNEVFYADTRFLVTIMCECSLWF